MQLVFAITLLLSAALLFLVEPMFAKMVLPRLGGTPGVWNTCLVFYQAVLLAGYLYVHAAIRLLGPRRQAALHLALLLLPWLVLPIAVSESWTPPAETHFVPWLLLLLTCSLGLPFFVVSAGAPMLQAWFADTAHPAAKDPYFLYAASNLGSMVALLGYPLVVEPSLSLSQQTWAWTAGYATLSALTLGCAVFLWRSPKGILAAAAAAPPAEPASQFVPGRQPAAGTTPAAGKAMAASPAWREPARWLALGFAPSSLLLGVTTHISTDIAAAPLLWVVPLALYLLSFVLVFARRTLLRHAWMVWLQPYLVVALGALWFHAAGRNIWVFLFLHLAAFFVTAMVCHGELARSRPEAGRLTEFYVWMSVGGVLGGVFNALLAPLLFPTVVEYPLMVVVACMLRPHGRRTLPTVGASLRNLWAPWGRVAGRVSNVSLECGHACHVPSESGHVGNVPHVDVSHTRARWLDFLLPALLAALAAGLVWGFDAAGRSLEGWPAAAILAGAGLVALVFQRRPVRFGLAVAAVLVASLAASGKARDLMHVERSFFGVLRVRYDSTYPAHVLLNGSTIHGMQSLKPDLRHQPVSYYHRTGPLGDVFRVLSERGGLREIGVVGLGTGTIAAYGQPGQRITFYEINPAVLRIARDARYFTYLCEHPTQIEVVLGDARQTLARAPHARYDLLVLDAFSSDAIPLHLITREAIALDFDKLAERGVLAVHISNRYLDLEPVLGNLAADAGLACRIRKDIELTAADKQEGKLGSVWVAMARREEDLGALCKNPRWRPLAVRPQDRLWCDDYSNIVGVMKWW